MAYRDPDQGRAADRARFRKRTAERKAAGLCPRCGECRPEDGLALCGVCAEKRRASERAHNTRRRAAGVKRRQARLDAGMCTRCGHRPPVDGGTVCGRCRDARRAAERGRYRRLRERGLCVTCGAPDFDGQSRCGVCATVEGERRDSAGKNDAARRRYAERRARNACTDCGHPRTAPAAAPSARSGRMSGPRTSAASRYGSPPSR